MWFAEQKYLVLRKNGFAKRSQLVSLRLNLLIPLTPMVISMVLPGSYGDDYSGKPEFFFAGCVLALGTYLTLKLLTLEPKGAVAKSKGPFTGFAYDRDGKHFLDLADDTKLAGFPEPVFFFSGHKMVHDRLVRDIPGYAKVVMDMTIAAKEDTEDFEREAESLVEEAVLAAWGILVDFKPPDNPLNATNVSSLLQCVMISLHEKERRIRFALKFRLVYEYTLFTEPKPH